MTPSHHDPFRTAMAKTRRALLYCGFFSLFVNVLQLTMPLYMMQVFDRVLASGSRDTLLYLSLVAMLALVVGAVLDGSRSHIMNRIGIWLERSLSLPTFERAVNAALARRSYATEATRDLGTLRNFISGSPTLSLLDIPWVPVYLFFIYTLHPLIGILATVGAVMLMALAIVAEVATRRPLGEASIAGRAAFQSVLSATRHADVVDAMGMLPGIAARWYGRNDLGLALQSEATDTATVILSVTKFVRMALQIAVLGLGAWLVVQGEFTGGAMMAGSIIMSRALAPVEQAIGTWKQVIGVRGAVRRLKDFFATPPRPAGMALPAPKGHLAVERVSFLHPGQKHYILRDVAFAVAPGEVVAITGPSAAGKSTLARLILGTWRPVAGTVRLDGADVYQWARADFGRHVGFLPQEIELFAGTVRDNIARMTDAEPERIVEAARLADVHDMILTLPNGYDTEIGERGLVLSGGQRQRVALARAFFGRPRLVVLDEPDSNLDRDGEESLARAIRNMRDDGAAVLVIAHRATLIEVVDKVLVLRGGMVEMFGPAQEVAARLGRGGRPGAPALRPVSPLPQVARQEGGA